MAWTLAIHHLDVHSVGDATIFVAIQNGITVRTVLIDGGKKDAGTMIDNYLKNTLNVDRLDVMVATHFDEDHFCGLIPLLEKDDALYANTIVYDSGKQQTPANQTKIKSGPDQGKYRNKYLRYREAITRKGTNTWKNKRTHATGSMNGYDIVSFTDEGVPSAPALADVLAPNWLLGKEIMWGDGKPAFASVPPVGAPTITCIAANKYVLQQNGGTSLYITTNRIYDGPQLPEYRMSNGDIKNRECGEGEGNKNARSLAFLVKFNNFRYYVGGDLEWPQEDGCDNINSLHNPRPFYQGAKFFLNADDNLHGRILAMKTSHHGSDTASSRDFINRLRPSAAFISTGEGSKHKHPAEATVNVLDGYLRVPINGDPQTRNRHPAVPPPPPIRPVRHYVTGFQDPVRLEGFGGDASQTAGDPRAGQNLPGHIKLQVTDEQSRRPVTGQTYRGILAAATTINGILAPNDQLPQATLERAAELGTTFGVAEAIAAILGAAQPEVIARAAKDAAAWAGALGSDENTANILIDIMIDAIRSHNDPAIAIRNAGLTTQLNALPAPALPTAIAAVSGQSSASIRQAATNAGASRSAADAAAYAAYGCSTELAGRNSGFAAVAAIAAAVTPGATVQQAAMVGAGIGAAMPRGRDHLGVNPSSAQTAYIVALTGTQSGVAAGVASIAGAVAGSAFYAGDATAVGASVEWALIAGGVNAMQAELARNTAMQAASLRPNGYLFSVDFESINGYQYYYHEW